MHRLVPLLLRARVAGHRRGAHAGEASGAVRGDREREEGEVTPRSGEADEDEVAFTLDCVDARSVVKVLRGHTGHFVTFVHF